MTPRIVGIIVLLSVAIFSAPLPSEAQQAKKVPRIGYLAIGSPSTNPARREAFRQGLRELGYVEGKNIVIESRYAEGKLDHLPALAAELADRPDDSAERAGAGGQRHKMTVSSEQQAVGST